MTNKNITIQVPVLARVEGEGAMELSIKDGRLDDLRLRIYEPPRFFEKFLEGRGYREVPDIVARICGICPVAYQMSAVHAIEQIFQTKLTPALHDLRRLMYCGEWLESHALHIHLLALPDFLGFDSAISMAEKYPDEVRRGLKLQQFGNQLIRLLGGRSVHPVSVRAGGFYKMPEPQQIDAVKSEIPGLLEEVESLIQWIARLELPDDEQDFVSVALRHEAEYPMNQGRIVSSAGLDLAIEEYQNYFTETQVPHSTAFHSHLQGEPYLVGPLARLNLNHDRLPQGLRDIITTSEITFPSQNMFHSMLARAVEIYYALYEAKRIIEDLSISEPVFTAPSIQAGIGFGCTEAPRGILWHRYELNETGNVMSAVIIPPTSQNQARIEQDLRTSLTRFGLDKPDDLIRLHGEKIIRNYDPCISCATHFLKVRVQRS